MKKGVAIENPLRIEYFIGHEREGTYFTLPFNMPPDIETFSLTYRYERHREGAAGEDGFASRQEVNIIDLGLIAPDGTQVGASGSDKSSIQVSEMQISASGLLAGDMVRVVTAQGSTSILEAKTAGKLQTTFKMEATGFARLEILRSFAPGILPLLPVLLSNPIYFEAG
ncbi:MAG: hypothetical protein AB1531_06160 [Chloroflexota bacterium]